MDRTAQFTLIAKRILGELRVLGETVSAGFLGVQKQVKAISEEQKAQDEREKTPPVLRAELQIPEAIQAGKRSNDRSKQRRERWSLFVQWVTLFAVIAYAIINYHMLCQMREANKTASDSFAKTLGQMQAQTAAQQQPANAAEQSAKTANVALHISEKAYISVGFPLLDLTKMAVSLPLSNSGRIPSGAVEVVAHEVTADRTPIAPANVLVEYHWKRFRLPSIAPGSSLTGRDNPSLLMVLPAASRDKIETGYETVTVAGRVTYNNGFPEDHPETRLFCSSTIYHLIEKQIVWVSCDPASLIPRMESVDGFPNNEQK